MVAFSRTQMRSQKGQIGVEMVLLIALSIGIFMGISSIFREKQYFANILSKPWSAVSSMIQNGVWKPGEPHPNHRSRWVSVRGEDQ